MATKMKGLLKGLRYISQIFEEEKEPEMQIGFPTDVKHVAHIGWDGPSVHSPSWMSKFKSTPEFSSAPMGLGSVGDNHANEGPPVKWASEDSSRRSSLTLDSTTRDSPELPRSSRRQSPNESPVREKSEKSKSSRRHHSSESGSSTKKDSSHKTKINRQLQDLSIQVGNESPSNSLPADIPKKSRRKKSKDLSVGGSTRSSRSKGNNSNNNNNNNNISSSTYEAPFSDPGPEKGSTFTNNEPYQTSTLQAYEEREDQKLGIKGIF